MNREIKFRGKTESNQFIFGDLIQYENGVTAIWEKEITGYGYEATQISNRTKVDIGTISQFTGLLDKDGNEIYEGDILMCIGQREDNKGRKYIRNVLFTNGAFGMKLPEWKCVSCLCNHIVNGKINWEIVGNIFDNSELIDG